MIDKKETLDKVLEIWKVYPDWRLGQLICNLAVWERDANQDAIWELTNEEIVSAINSHLAKKT